MRRTIAVLVLITVALLVNAADRATPPGDYPNKRLLMEPQALTADRGSLLILDVRDKGSYGAGHIPSALSAPHDAWQKGFAESRDPEKWSVQIGKLGIDGTMPVLIYDDASGNNAARVWFILRYFGVKDVRLLNGFWKGWLAGSYPVETKEIEAFPVKFVASPNEKLRATTEEILGQLSGKTPKNQILDARTLAEHVGKSKLSNPRAGHLPGACHLDWLEVIDTKGTQRFKPAPELQQLLDNAGIDVNKPIVTHCQGGGRSAVMMFTINLLGGEEVANYYESFGEWSKDPQAPIVEGEAIPPKQ